MVYVILIAAAALLVIALYLLLCMVLRIPSARAARLASKYAPRASAAEELERIFVRPLAEQIAPIIPMRASREARRDRVLDRAGIRYTAKQYTARNAILLIYVILFGGLLSFAGLNILSIAAIAFGAVLVYQAHRRPDKALQARQRAIEYELPRFIRTFIHGLGANRNILALLERYAQNSTALRKDIDRLIADIKTSNYEDALERFDRAIDIPALSNFVSALIAQSRGIDQSATFAAIANSMSTLHIENVRRELNKRPGKIKLASIPMVIMIVVLYGFILITNLVQSFAAIL